MLIETGEYTLHSSSDELRILNAALLRYRDSLGDTRAKERIVVQQLVTATFHALISLDSEDVVVDSNGAAHLAGWKQ